MEKIAAVVVTFNRKKLLMDCIDGLINQTTKIDKIYIIDNNSSDGTIDLLKAKGILDTPNVKYRNLGSNRGGAGGFYEGVKEAYDDGNDWIFIMDDDVEPLPSALEEMLKFKDQSKCIHPTKVYSDHNNEIMTWDGYFDPRTSLSHRKKNEAFREKSNYTTVNYGCFEGMLIHRSIVKRIGFPDERFFIVGDDLIYGYLASLHTPVYYLRDAIFKKKIYKIQYSSFLSINRPFQSPFTLYFNARNHFLKKEYLISTNKGSVVLINLVLLGKSIKLILETFLFFRTKQHILRCVQGIWDGINSNYKGHNRFISQ